MLPDRSVLIGQKLVENAKIQNSNPTFWVTFYSFLDGILRNYDETLDLIFNHHVIVYCCGNLLLSFFGECNVAREAQSSSNATTTVFIKKLVGLVTSLKYLDHGSYIFYCTFKCSTKQG